MRPWIRKSIKAVVALVAIFALLVGAGLVGFKVLVNRLPSYQDDLQAWVNEALGVRLTYAGVDARWGLSGPELTFRDATVAAADDAAPFLTARVASVGVSPIGLAARLLTQREVGIDRLTFEGTELTIVQTEDGELTVQGASSSAARRPDFALNVPPEVEVLVRDSRVLYFDQRRGFMWDFQDVAGSMRREQDALLIEAQARPRSDVARSIEVTAQGFIEEGPVDDAASPAGGAKRGPRFSGDWRVSAQVEEIDLVVAGRLLPSKTGLPSSNLLPLAGRGDVGLWVEWKRGTPVGGSAKLALAGVELPAPQGAAASRYDRLGLTADWSRSDENWRVELRDIALEREGRSWPGGSGAALELENGASGLARVALRADFVRLEDVTPLLGPVPESRLLQSWFALEPRGDLRGIDLELQRGAAEGAVDYRVSAEFAGLGVEPIEGLPGVRGATGVLRADSRSGRVELKTTDAGFEWPAMFRAPFEVSELSGLVVWRQGQDALRIVSDDLVLATADASTRSNLELTVPADGSSPRLDLASTVSGFDLTAARKYLPAPKMPPVVVEWLDGALAGGRARSASVSFVGPLAAFPFDGHEGEFRAKVDLDRGVLAYVSDWPRAEDLDGTVEFVNASFTAQDSGRALGNRAANVRVAIPDLRDAVLGLTIDTIGPLDQVLAYLRGAPLIAQELGSDFERLSAPNGTGEAHVSLSLPLKDRDSYKLDASLGMIDGELAFRGFGPHATEINGKLTLEDGVLRGEGIQAIFLDGPITARVDPPGVEGYRTRIALEGEVTIDAVADAFDLPFADRLAGQTRWQGALLIPAVGGDERMPPRITVDSNLSGVALRFPAPFAKAPGEPTNLQVDLTFPATGGLDMQGYLGASRRFALQFDEDAGAEGKFEFRRAALRFGGVLPELRVDRGVTVDGSVPELPVDDWLALADGNGGGGGFGTTFAGGSLDVAGLTAFGQELGRTKVSARRRTDDWQVDLDSDPVAGTLLIPVDLDRDPQVVAVMRRLYLSAGDGTPAARHLDPRQLPGLQLHADEFAVGQRLLGRLDAEILSDPLGLRLASFESSSESFSAQGSGGWFVGADGSETTRFAVSVSSTDLAKTFAALGFDPIIEGKSAEVTASVYWPGAPNADWMQHVGGDVALKAEKGSLIDVAPGAGRVVGLLSLSTLPRRLALDFRDVFNRGLVFDEITADFVLVDGNAYTDNLKLTGPVAEVGAIGRTGLRDKDYRQQFVVTAEPGKVLPTVGALLGGPGVAAALLIFTRIFKKPLAGIGRASYCVTGSWAEPMVERLTAEQLEKGELCAELPPGAKPAEVAAR
ncbi:MAG TPA: YhdP family protein [Gammaproteobacteria bacterium]|nr:YhdP family protein [Gammaproteobacteria bacterium]